MYICVYISILLITHFATENHRSDGLFPVIYLSDSALWVIAIMNKCVTVSVRGMFVRVTVSVRGMLNL